MKDINTAFTNELIDDLFDDEIDQLYCQLEKIEPPAFLVDSIMSSVARLPQTQFQSRPVQGRTTSLNDLSDLLMGGIAVRLA